MRKARTGFGAIAMIVVLAAWSWIEHPRALAAMPKVQDATITSLRELEDSPMVEGGAGVEIELSSDASFDIEGQQLILKIGAMHFEQYSFPQGDTHTVVFVIDKTSFDELPDGSSVTVVLGLQRGQRWDAGVLNKSLLRHD
ncbi:MAG: hypothetical protein ACLQDV_05810 [Candidatus Binataceae bacterium]